MPNYKQLRDQRFHKGQEPGFLQKLFLSPVAQRQYRENHWKTSRGDAVKSRGEMLIADYLHQNRISYEYERKIFIGEEWAKPDFLLTGWSYRLIVEFWGSKHKNYLAKIPKRRKKLLSYPKYNLIDVYPKHLKTLDSYLDKEIKEKKAGIIHV